MKGKIHGIWFSMPGTKLHPKNIPNLTLWQQQSADAGFEVVLWTDVKGLEKQEQEQLLAAKVKINDFSECKASSLYSYALHFIKLGLQGDKAAFALASDILRMCVLEFTPAEEYFIYADPNDVIFKNLKARLAELDKFMTQNTWGFSFCVDPMFGRLESFQIRNDVIVALKKVNPQFFADYLKAYQRHVELNYRYYYKPVKDEQAQDLARLISNQTTPFFFNMDTNTKVPTVIAKFGNYKLPFPSVNCLALLPYGRDIHAANTWLPEGKLEKEKAEHKREQLKQMLLEQKANPPEQELPEQLYIVDAKGLIQSYSPLHSETQNELYQLRLAVGNDIIKKVAFKLVYEISTSWLQQVNTHNPAGITKLASILKVSEKVFREQLGLNGEKIYMENKRKTPAL